ncbi:hypothetical protein K1T71_000384 [Dendrolimus kikuchii]|uniref:Uncharacterized protein n=1 Tax=Dendrolimus kikuchii TaxID=765133 RepID=A0ACC1DKL6_9NEOP|nr:hypothetical protein K1T71_000384 [Dendrolimus kikuchii]
MGNHPVPRILPRAWHRPQVQPLDTTPSNPSRAQNFHIHSGAATGVIEKWN